MANQTFRKAMLVLSVLALVVACDEENNDWGQGPPPDGASLSIENGATAVSVPTVNVNSTSAVNTTTISAQFTDSEAQNAQDFEITIRIRLGADETILIDAKKDSEEPDLSITDNGDGTFTAEYEYDPDASQDLGAYDVQFEVARGSEKDTDEFGNNTGILTLVSNFAPVLTAGPTAVPPAVDIDGNPGPSTTTISVQFQDADEPDVSTFRVTFQIKDADGPVDDLVTDGVNGANSVTISGANGLYQASLIYNPGNSVQDGDYDLCFVVKDLSGGAGYGSATDVCDDTPNELQIDP